ncbi:MAG: general secretion pathway protein C [Burkholderiaceae bacterium]|nr:general secretion pathway protein C [Burkholderiaceae bacterium]
MVKNSESRWAVRLTTLALWALAAASAVYWGLRLSAPSAGLAVSAAAAAPVAPDAQAVARLLGVGPAVAMPTAPVASAGSRFALLGVLSGRSSGGGAALIAIDGQPAKPFRVGAVVDAGLVLLALEPRQARLGAAGGPASLTLEMPPRL